MPFPQQDSRPFNWVGLETLNANQLGVYGLSKQGQWIYVGKGDIRQRLLDHLNGDNSCVTKQAPTHFVAEVTSNMDAREIQPIWEL